MTRDKTEIHKNASIKAAIHWYERVETVSRRFLRTSRSRLVAWASLSRRATSRLHR
jgi:hypothetical protein